MSWQQVRSHHGQFFIFVERRFLWKELLMLRKNNGAKDMKQVKGSKEIKGIANKPPKKPVLKKQK